MKIPSSRALLYALPFACLAIVSCGDKTSASPKDAEPLVQSATELLIFTRTAGFEHSSIPTGVICVAELAQELGLTATETKDPADFTDANLERFAAVVFLSTTGDVLDPAGQSAFERYIQSGGAYLGIHAATDTEYEWPWYTGLSGAQFASHPKIQEAHLVPTKNSFPATAFLPTPWVRTDEWYNFKAISPDIMPVLMLDESSYEGGTNGAHPAAWYQTYDGGRAFYTAGGHTEGSYGEPLFRRHLKEALAWLIKPQD
jgi:type 1 glutamine amidotransferase